MSRFQGGEKLLGKHFFELSKLSCRSVLACGHNCFHGLGNFIVESCFNATGNLGVYRFVRQIACIVAMFGSSLWFRWAAERDFACCFISFALLANMSLARGGPHGRQGNICRIDAII